MFGFTFTLSSPEKNSKRKTRFFGTNEKWHVLLPVFTKLFPTYSYVSRLSPDINTTLSIWYHHITIPKPSALPLKNDPSDRPPSAAMPPKQEGSSNSPGSHFELSLILLFINQSRWEFTASVWPNEMQERVGETGAHVQLREAVSYLVRKKPTSIFRYLIHHIYCIWISVVQFQSHFSVRNPVSC